MDEPRKDLENVLSSYTKDTLSFILRVKSFCDDSSKWISMREKELDSMMKVKEEKELEKILRDTLDGLKKLDRFLDAVEKLAVTSLNVFMKNEMLRLPEDVTFKDIQDVLQATAIISSLLVQFKNDKETFFQPKINNGEVLAHWLDKYILITKAICTMLEKSCSFDFRPENINKIKVNIPVGLSEEKIQRMLAHIKKLDEISCSFDFRPENNKIKFNIPVGLSEEKIQRMLAHIKKLDEIRMDENFRMVFLFKQKIGQQFVNEFTERHPRMLEFLQQLEETAIQLSRMHTGAKISSVAGSSVGLAGGLMSITGLILMPFTFGASTPLLIGGLGLGVTSGVNSVVTVITESKVNKAQTGKARELFQNFMKDVESLKHYVDQGIVQMAERLKEAEVDGKLVAESVVGFFQNVIDSFVLYKEINPGIKLTGNVVASTVETVVEEAELGETIVTVASVARRAGQVAAQSSMALSKIAMRSLIGVNALFVGLDAVIIITDSISLYKGSQSEAAQFISERVVLWRSVLGSWHKINDSLTEGLLTAEKKEAALSRPFYNMG